MSISEFLSLVGNAAVLNNIILLLFFTLFGVQFYRENKKDNTVYWTDLLIDSKTQKLSLTKMGQFWGIALSSWIVIFLAQKPESYSMFPAVFAAWLAFIGGTYAFYLKERKEDSK
jgi:hypothetical protein